MSRPFQFYPEKAIEAVAFLLRRERGHRMNYMRLLKVLYIAEREILAESSTPLTRSTVVAMERGPVLEDVLHLIRGEHTPPINGLPIFRLTDTNWKWSETRG